MRIKLSGLPLCKAGDWAAPQWETSVSLMRMGLRRTTPERVSPQQVSPVIVCCLRTAKNTRSRVPAHSGGVSQFFDFVEKLRNPTPIELRGNAVPSCSLRGIPRRERFPQCLASNVSSLRLQAAEMRLRLWRTPLSVCMVFFADQKWEREGTEFPRNPMMVGFIVFSTKSKKQ